MNAAIDSVLSEVATSGDVVSLELQPIFELARNETPEELESARFRLFTPGLWITTLAALPGSFLPGRAKAPVLNH